MTPKRNASGFLPPFMADDRFHLALQAASRKPIRGLASNYHQTRTGRRHRDQGCARAERRLDRQRRQGLRRQWPDRQVDHRLGTTDVDAGKTGTHLFSFPHDAAGLTVRETSRPNAPFTALAAIVPVGLPGSRRKSAQGRTRRATRRRPPDRLRHQSRHRPRRLRGRARLCAIRVQGGRRIIEHQAIGTKLAEIAIRLEVARNAVWQAAWASDHPDAVADRSLSDLPLQLMAQVFTSSGGVSRRQGCRGGVRRHGRDARHAAAEIRPRCPGLPALRRRQHRRQAADCRSVGGLRRRSRSSWGSGTVAAEIDKRMSRWIFR